MRQGIWNCILPVWNNIFRKKTLSDLFLLINFRILSKKISDF